MATPRRLARINATRNSSYTAAVGPDDPRESIVEYPSQTSFHIRGEHAAEIASLYRQLGLSGPEDLSIPPAVYAAAMSHLSNTSRRSSRELPKAFSEEAAPDGEAGAMGLARMEPPEVPSLEVMAETRLGTAEEGAGADLGNKFAESELPEVSMRADEGTGAEPSNRLVDSVLVEVSGWEVAAEAKPENAGDEKGDAELVKVEEELREDSIRDVVVEAERGTRGAVAVIVPEPSSSSDERLVSPSPNRRFRRTIRSWIKGGHLGSGSFGSVFEAISDDGFFFAVKEVSLLDQGINAKQCIFQLEQEISLLSRFEHENIVQYFGTDKENAKLYIFLELVTQGSLAVLYQKYHLQDSQVSVYTRQILNGLNYLHQRNVVHRDIKCANILVDANGLVKLADFGLAKEMTILNQAKSTKGTVYWMAPEVAKAKPYGPSADIWSLGCTVLEMLTRRLPYPDIEWTHALFKIGRGIPPSIPNTLSHDACDFIMKCVQVNPNDRPSASQLLEHPFVQRPLLNQEA